MGEEHALDVADLVAHATEVPDAVCAGVNHKQLRTGHHGHTGPGGVGGRHRAAGAAQRKVQTVLHLVDHIGSQVSFQAPFHQIRVTSVVRWL